MKKLLFLSSIVVLLVAMKKPETTRPLTFEQAMTHANIAYTDLLATDTSDATWDEKHDLAVAKMQYVDQNWVIQNELNARPCCGTLCSVMGLFNWYICWKGQIDRNRSAARECHAAAQNAANSCHQAWPWLPKP